MNAPHNDLDKLKLQKKKLERLLRFSKIFDGKINVSGELITTSELKNYLEHLKFEIAAHISQNNLRIIKPKDYNGKQGSIR